MGRTVKASLRSLEVWESNLKVLRELQPLLCARLEDYTARQGHLFEHIETDAENGVWVEGLTQTPFFQSEAFPPMPWKDAGEAEGSVLFIYGVGSVPWLHVLLRSLPPGVISVLVLEPSIGLLAYTLHTTSVYRIMPEGCRIFFAASSETAEIREALIPGIMDMGTFVASRLGAYCHPGEVVLCPEEFGKLGAEVHSQLVIRLLQLGNSLEDTLLGMRQMALLSPWIALGARLSQIKDIYKGRPFIWVASGPSLDKNFRLLKENDNRAVIVCADTAAAKLLGAGITPHIVVALERGSAVHDYMEKLYTRFPEEAKRILLAAQAVCVQEVVGKWPGPAAVVGKAELKLDRWLVGGVLGGDLVVSGLSVAHMGVWIASFMGASSIALIGQDLAFGSAGSSGRVSHAADTVTGAAVQAEITGEYRALKEVIQVPGALGGVVETHEIWRVFLSMMEDYMPLIGCPVFDCTEGGALIKGTTVTPLRDWMEKFLDSGISPFKLSPAEAVLNAHGADTRGADGDAENHGAQAAAVALRVADELRFMDEAGEDLEKIAKGIGQVAAPALSQEMRQKLAGAVYRSLDTFHLRYPVMELIGQGMGGANAMAIARNRLLGDAPSVKAWESALMDVVKSYRISFRFIKTWLAYISAAVSGTPRLEAEGHSLEAMPFFPSGSIRDLNGLEKELGTELAEKLLALPLQSRVFPSDGIFAALDNLLARADHKWWRFWHPLADWRAALILEKAGRYAEASSFMARFERTELNIFGLPDAEEREFYRDYARILTAHDFCRDTDWKKVSEVLEKASPPNDLLSSVARAREKDAAIKAKVANVRGACFFAYVPQYAAEELSRMVRDIGWLASATLYNKERFLDFEE